MPVICVIGGISQRRRWATSASAERDHEPDRDADQRQLDVLDQRASCSAPSCRRSSPGRSRCARRSSARRRCAADLQLGEDHDLASLARASTLSEPIALPVGVDDLAVQRAVLEQVAERVAQRARRRAISGPPLAEPSSDVGDRISASRLSARSAPTKSSTNVVRGVQEQLGRRRVLGELAADLQDRDPVAHLDRLVDVVGDEDDRLADLGLQAQELVLEAVAVDRVDRAERLVHQHQRRVGGERAGDADALALAAGELRRVALGHLLRQPDQVEQLVDAVGDPAACPSRAASGPWRCCQRSYGAGTGRSAGSRSRCRAAGRPASRSLTLRPPSRMSPEVMSIIRLTIRIAVVLPQPDGPTSTQISPGRDGQAERVDGGLSRRRGSAWSPRRTPARPLRGSRTAPRTGRSVSESRGGPGEGSGGCYPVTRSRRTAGGGVRGVLERVVERLRVRGRWPSAISQSANQAFLGSNGPWR